MKLLFLDDDKNRHEMTKKMFIGVDIRHVWTAEEAIKALNEEHFDEVSLDHDLGGSLTHGTLPGVGEGSGYDVACHLAALPMEKLPKTIIIHSWNPEGARRMGVALWELKRIYGVRIYKAPFTV